MGISGMNEYLFSRKDGRNKLVAIQPYEHAFEPQEGSSRKQIAEPDKEASFERQRRAVGSGNSNPDAEEAELLFVNVRNHFRDYASCCCYY